MLILFPFVLYLKKIMNVGIVKPNERFLQYRDPIWSYYMLVGLSRSPG